MVGEGPAWNGRKSRFKARRAPLRVFGWFPHLGWPRWASGDVVSIPRNPEASLANVSEVYDMRCLRSMFERSTPSDIGVDPVLCLTRPSYAGNLDTLANDRADFFKAVHRGADFIRADADKFSDFLVGKDDDAGVGLDMGDYVVEDTACCAGFWIVGVDSVPNQETLSWVD